GSGRCGAEWRARRGSPWLCVSEVRADGWWLVVGVLRTPHQPPTTNHQLASRRVRPLGVHQLEAAPELCVARVLERGQGAGVVEELFAAQGAAAAGLAAFAQQGPGAEQVRLQGQLHEAGCFVGIGTLLQEQAHGPAIVRPGPGCAPGAAAAAPQPASTARTSASATSDSTRARPAPSQTM